ncbi:hypothetical protein R3P38DRAFT_3571367 [Favolaschia claudopus]|uniref:Uncharacterized protein n=1 Tax=Favolaschia claudopus TaxID=2862362 RepID=A0AAW0AQC6_9AGAR
MPSSSSTTRQPAAFSAFRVRIASVTSPLLRSFKSSASDLSSPTLDADPLPPSRSAVEIPRILQAGRSIAFYPLRCDYNPHSAASETLSLSSPRQPAFDLPRHDLRQSSSDERGSASLAVDPSAETSFSMTIPLIQLSPPPPSSSTENLTSMLNVVKEPHLMQNSRIGELGRRRGFKGAPLFTPETAKKPRTSTLSPVPSPRTPRSPRLSPCSPSTPRPSTPRTPLATVTNLLRTPTMKSPKLPPTPIECPVADELQQFYDLQDPFSVLGQSFYDPDTVFTAVPLANLGNLDVYWLAHSKDVRVTRYKTFFNAQAAAVSKTIIYPETNVYRSDLKKENIFKQDYSCLSQSVVSTSSTTSSLLLVNGQPEVRLPPHAQQNYDLSTFTELPTPCAGPVDVNFCGDLHTEILWDTQTIVVGVPHSRIEATLLTARSPTIPHPRQ